MNPVVLVVEDEELVRNTLCAVLTTAGFTTRRARTVDEALRVLGTERVDAITLDVALPDPKGLQRSGLSLLGYLRSIPEHESLPVFVLTGTNLTHEDEKLLNRHRAQLFQKPQAYSGLIEQISAALPPEHRPAVR